MAGLILGIGWLAVGLVMIESVLWRCGSEKEETYLGGVGWVIWVLWHLVVNDATGCPTRQKQKDNVVSTLRDGEEKRCFTIRELASRNPVNLANSTLS